MIYTISDLERLSGVQSHTIRIWEKRYNALKPMRSQGNTRLYDDDQLKKLLNIVSLNQSGLKISKICSLSNHAVDKLIVEQNHYQSGDELGDYYIAQLIKHGLAFDETSFCILMEDCIKQFGMAETYKRVMYPLLVRLGLMWRKDDICPAHEHFLSNLIRQKLFSAINNVPVKENNSKTWLLFLPEDEDHDIGLLFANYLLRLNNQKVIFLGSKVPLSSIKRVFSTVNIDHVLLFLVRTRLPKQAQAYIDELSNLSTAAQIHLAGNFQVIEKLKNIPHIKYFKTLSEFENTIQNLAL